MRRPAKLMADSYYSCCAPWRLLVRWVCRAARFFLWLKARSIFLVLLAPVSFRLGRFAKEGVQLFIDLIALFDELPRSLELVVKHHIAPSFRRGAQMRLP